MVDVTKQIYSEKIEKSPDFAKDIVVVFSDDVSVETMQLFREKESKEWMKPMLKEIILDWNLFDEKNEKLPISIEGLDKIKSLKLRNWILITLQEFIVERLSILKKK